MTSPVPFNPASVSGVDVTVAVWIFARAAAFKRAFVCHGATLTTSSLPAKNEMRPMKHATCSSTASSRCPPTPLPL